MGGKGRWDEGSRTKEKINRLVRQENMDRDRGIKHEKTREERMGMERKGVGKTW